MQDKEIAGLLESLRAESMPGERQARREARIELWTLLQAAADAIEYLIKKTNT